MNEEWDFRGAKEILQRIDVYETFLSIETSIPSNITSAGELNDAIAFHLHQWNKNHYVNFRQKSNQGYSRAVRFQYDFLKERVAVEVELSYQNKIYHSLVRLFIGYREGLIDAGVLITTNTKMGSAGPRFDKTKDWIELANLDVPLLLIGIL